MQKNIISISIIRFALMMLFVWFATCVFMIIIYTIYPWEPLDSFARRIWLYSGLADILALSKL